MGTPPSTSLSLANLASMVYVPLVSAANLPPDVPAHPFPADGAGGISTATELNWTGGDPNGDAVTYRVYLEADDPTPDEVLDVVSNSAAAPGALEPATDYYWRVLARDTDGARTEGPIWHFTTAAAECDRACQVIVLTNQERAKVGCPPLSEDPRLTAAAETHSEDMALNDFFSHTGSGGSTFAERIEATGYEYTIAAENVAIGYPTAARAVAAWMASTKGHRENILNCELTEIGVGYYYLENDGGSVEAQHYWTQDFATPAE
jgi:uncharacterized protein YkwD